MASSLNSLSIRRYAGFTDGSVANDAHFHPLAAREEK